MQKQLNQLIEFHTKFEVPFRTTFDQSTPESIDLRKKIMREEIDEWYYAAKYVDPIQNRAKELADVLYTVLGTIITEGLQDVIERVFDEVHRSNMSKLGVNGEVMRREDGKVLKGPNYKQPDLSFLASPVTIKN